MINEDRLCHEFARQAAIDSPSFQEAAICAYLQDRLTQLGCHVEQDQSGKIIGSSGNNLIARYPGSQNRAPLLLTAHMDTVTPADNVQPLLKDGIFTSGGETVLGADDKSGIAAIIEAIEVLREQKIDHAPLEIVITICEEKGLLGAKKLDFSKLKAKHGIALDTSGIDRIINRAPAANRFTMDIFGLEAHAGVCPEQGISAIEIAARAIARMALGRIDEETTANIGTIEGGSATNIVANRVTLRGEVRSHDPVKLREHTEKIIGCVEQEVDGSDITVGGENKRATLSLELNEDFPAMQVAEDSLIVKKIVAAGQALNRPQKIAAAGGGSDANIFNGNGISTVIIGTGMDKIHTVNEQIAVADMVQVSRLLVEIIRSFS